ncbi:hypothetical protein B0T17DRAFT_522839 [Bombardia bombarda]|uniref:Uncharacterized protein n=1 Tax=Bombardia bombarda TaxID=252184 RepID=A0AA39X713_9PEZI|nr:hypothetical protein B0T17DRAFT_522839 [Bombardia bombarda]
MWEDGRHGLAGEVGFGRLRAVFSLQPGKDDVGKHKRRGLSPASGISHHDIGHSCPMFSFCVPPVDRKRTGSPHTADCVCKS